MIEVFDFDGTLIDLWPRYYHVFCEASGVDNRQIEFNEYKMYKRLLQKDDSVAKVLGINLPENYYENKRVMLEADDYLLYDVPLIDASSISGYFKHNNCILLTRRRNRPNFFKELERLNYHIPEDRIDVIIDDSYTKLQWLNDNIRGEQICMVGDGKEELNVAISRNDVKFYFVNTGLLDNSIIKKNNYNNIIPIKNIEDILARDVL